MGSFSHGIADAIRRMGDAQAQGALQKGAVYGNLAHEIGQAPMQYLAIDRGLHENKYRQTMQAAQEKKLKDDQEFEALINQTPPGPERLKVSLEFWQGRDPEKYHALVTGAYQAATQAVGAQQGRPGQPKLTPDPVSGEPTQIDQQTDHAPVQFPGAYGQEPFSVTPQTDTQVQSAANQQSGLKAFIESKMTALGKTQGEAGKERVYPGGSYVRSPTEEFQVPVAPRTDTSISPYEDFRSGDQTKHKNAQDYMNQSKDPEMVALRKALMQKTLDKPDIPGGRPRWQQFSAPDGSGARMVNINDSDELKEIESQGWVPGPPAKLSGKQQEDLETTGDLKAILEEIKAGYKPGRVGKFDSALGAIGEFTGLNSREHEDFRVQLQSLFNQTGKLRAGSAWTAPEIARLRSELPHVGQSDVQFQAALANMEKTLARKLESIKTVAAQTGTRLRPEAAPARGTVTPQTADEWLKNIGK